MARHKITTHSPRISPNRARPVANTKLRSEDGTKPIEELIQIPFFLDIMHPTPSHKISFWEKEIDCLKKLHRTLYPNEPLPEPEEQPSQLQDMWYQR